MSHCSACLPGATTAERGHQDIQLTGNMLCQPALQRKVSKHSCWWCLQLETIYVLDGLGPPPTDASSAVSDGPSFADQVLPCASLVCH